MYLVQERYRSSWPGEHWQNALAWNLGGKEDTEREEQSVFCVKSTNSGGL